MSPDDGLNFIIKTSEGVVVPVTAPTQEGEMKENKDQILISKQPLEKFFKKET